MQYARPVTYKGKQIWRLDAANKAQEAVLAAWDEAMQVMANNPEGCLSFIDATGMPMSIAVLNKMRKTADMARGDPRYRVAFIGMTGVAKSTAQVHATTRRVNARFFDTAESAMEWLIEEDGQRR